MIALSTRRVRAAARQSHGGALTKYADAAQQVAPAAQRRDLIAVHEDGSAVVGLRLTVAFPLRVRLTVLLLAGRVLRLARGRRRRGVLGQPREPPDLRLQRLVQHLREEAHEAEHDPPSSGQDHVDDAKPGE